MTKAVLCKDKVQGFAGWNFSCRCPDHRGPASLLESLHDVVLCQHFDRRNVVAALVFVKLLVSYAQ